MKLPPLKCLVTGATGFIGRPLCEALLAAGYEVYAQVRVGSDLRGLWDRPGVHLVFGHLSDLHWVANLPPDLELVFHLALNWDRLDEAEDVQFYEALKPFPLRHLVYFSSVCAAGLDLMPQPLREDTVPQFLTEDFYGKYKWAAEEVTRKYFSDGSATILRPTIVYGPGDKSNVYPLFEQIRRGRLALWNHGQVKCRLCSLENLIKITLAAPHSTHVGVKTYFVADAEDVPLRESGATIAEALDMRFLYDNYRLFLGRRLGFLRFVLSRLKIIDSSATHFAFNKWTRSYDTDITSMLTDFPNVELIPMTQALRSTADWYRREGWL